MQVSKFHSLCVVTGKIVTEVLREEYDVSQPCPELPKLQHLAKTANRHRAKLRPLEPQDLSFELDTEFIGAEFFQGEIADRGHRHVLLATSAMLQLLRQCKHWYMDSTFKVIKEPFGQLFAIHGFVRSGDNLKQVPLFFAAMSHRKKRDYVAVLSAVLKLVQQPNVRFVTLDFEAAMWRAISAVMPDVSISGCGFHWAQAVFRHGVQACGLQRHFMKDAGTYKFIKKLLALPYLPADVIAASFDELVASVTLTDGLSQLVDYVRRQWIAGRFSPENWSVYMKTVRTNNDTEGYHRKLNQEKHKMPFYLLVQKLHDEATDVVITATLVSERKVKRLQRRKYRTVEARLFTAWDRYANGELSAMRLLSECAHCTAF